MVMSGNNGNNKALNFNFSESEKEFFHSLYCNKLAYLRPIVFLIVPEINPTYFDNLLSYLPFYTSFTFAYLDCNRYFLKSQYFSLLKNKK